MAPPATRSPWTSALDKARATAAKAGCPDPPRELEPLTAFTEELNKNSGQITVDQARSLGGLLSELRKTLQVSPAAVDERLLDLPMTCEEISRQVSATYGVRSVRTRCWPGHVGGRCLFGTRAAGAYTWRWMANSPPAAL